MEETGCCQLCGDKIKDFRVSPHIYCIQYDTIHNNCARIGLESWEWVLDMTKKRDNLYLWITWLSPIMAGESSCHWASWFKVHYTGYEKAPSDFQLAIWATQHTEMVDKLAKERISFGDKVSKEDQNLFRVKRSSGLVVSGKPDLVAIAKSGQHIVYDAKTGNKSNSHIIQVMLYMMLLPYSQTEYKGKQFDGCVVYRDGQRVDIPSAVINDDFKERVSYFLNILESAVVPSPTPSFVECKFCDIGDSDCSSRCQTNIPRIIDGAEPDIPF
jgi:hypothetical protein